MTNHRNRPTPTLVQLARAEDVAREIAVDRRIQRSEFGVYIFELDIWVCPHCTTATPLKINASPMAAIDCSRCGERLS